MSVEITESVAIKPLLKKQGRPWRPFRIFRNGKRKCRVCGKQREVNIEPCEHCRYTDGFCVKGIETYL